MNLSGSHTILRQKKVKYAFKLMKEAFICKEDLWSYITQIDALKMQYATCFNMGVSAAHSCQRGPCNVARICPWGALDGTQIANYILAAWRTNSYSGHSNEHLSYELTDALIRVSLQYNPSSLIALLNRPKLKRFWRSLFTTICFCSRGKFSPFPKWICAH